MEKYNTGTQAPHDTIMLFRKDVVCMLDNEGKNTETHT